MFQLLYIGFKPVFSLINSIGDVACEAFNWTIEFFIWYILYLHFKWASLSWIPSPGKSHKPSSLPLFLHPPLPASLSWYSPTLLHWASPGPGASLPFDVQQGHPLLPICLEPWVTACVFVVDVFVPGSSGDTGWFILLFLLWRFKPLRFIGSFL